MARGSWDEAGPPGELESSCFLIIRSGLGKVPLPSQAAGLGSGRLRDPYPGHHKWLPLDVVWCLPVEFFPVSL